MKGLLNKKLQILSITLSVLASVFLVGVFVYAATTIGSNIETAGTATMESASTSNDFWVGNVTADDDDSIFFDASGSQYIMWDNSALEFELSAHLYVTGGATTTDPLYIGGFASTSGNIYVGMTSAGGDDYVYFDEGGNLEYLMWDNSPGMFQLSDDLAITGAASTTSYIRLGNLSGDDDDYLYMDASSSEYLSWDNAPGEFDFSDDVNITGKATSSISLWVGSGGNATNINLTGGDLYVQNDAEIDGGLYVDSATSTDTVYLGNGTPIREYNFGTCSFANRATFTASTTVYVECLTATGIASGDNIYVMGTSSLDADFIIQAASSTNANIISMRVMNTGLTGDTTLDGTSVHWQSIR